MLNYRKKIFNSLFIITAQLLCIIIMPIGYYSIRNYYGYCNYQGYGNGILKKGLRLTTDERLDIAIRYYLHNQISIDYREIAKAEQIERQQSDSLEERFKLIPYSSREENLKENPDCCERTWGEICPEIDQFFFRERASGAGDGMFNFKHKVRYTAQSGTYKERETTNTFIMVNNCGGVTNKFYYGNLNFSSSAK